MNFWTLFKRFMFIFWILSGFGCSLYCRNWFWSTGFRVFLCTCWRTAISVGKVYFIFFVVSTGWVRYGIRTDRGWRGCIFRRFVCEYDYFVYILGEFRLFRLFSSVFWDELFRRYIRRFVRIGRWFFFRVIVRRLNYFAFFIGVF